MESADGERRDDGAASASPERILHTPPPLPSEQPLAPLTFSVASAPEPPEGHTPAPTPRDKLWTYLHRCNVSKLRDFQRVLRLRRGKLKDDMMKSVLISAFKTHDEDGTQLLGCAVPGYGEWLNMSNIIALWKIAPALDVNTSTASLSFSLNDFARLMNILTYNEAVRAALLGSGRERTRRELESRASPYAFWDTEVAPAFNEAKDVCPFDFSGVLTGINATSIPSVTRTGPELRKHYSDARAQFTIAHERWSRSGQNDPTRFDRFCLRAQGEHELSAAGKRSLIMFVTYRCGSPGEMEDVTKFTLRTLPSDIATETGVENGIRGAARTQSTSNRKSALLLNAMETLNENVAEFTSSMVSAIRTRAQVGDDDDDRRFKKIQRLELVLRAQSGLTAAAEPSVVQCLRDEANSIVSALRESAPSVERNENEDGDLLI